MTSESCKQTISHCGDVITNIKVQIVLLNLRFSILSDDIIRLKDIRMRADVLRIFKKNIVLYLSKVAPVIFQLLFHFHFLEFPRETET